ncbi:hypothetical protein K2173_005783 [Erythroxylum novogranatense]|uniref:LysM domain-containing protein n=1 Tax=Erythroxylum novogranatense TaxID=1862640 RepID=A0AAV8U2M2_9ROSI|nr:hypothetical protein K2173_005783 [Erythroxylum novogranatense]
MFTGRDALHHYENVNNTQFCNVKVQGKDRDGDEKKEQLLDPLLARISFNDHKKVAATTPSSSATLHGFIEHPVSKFDTLAGVAIKYGVEVSDIKKLNGLVTDLQMFALKSLQIPLPGRHPPSPCPSKSSGSLGQNNSVQTPPCRMQADIFDSIKTVRPNSSEWKISAAMSSLQGYYGLKPNDVKSTHEGFEMAVYREGNSNFLEDALYQKSSSSSCPPLSLNRKYKSLFGGLLDGNNGGLVGHISFSEPRGADGKRLNKKSVNMPLKSEADSSYHSPEMLIGDDANSGGAFSTITGKGLALRSKAGSRSNLSAEPEAGWVTPIPISTGDSLLDDGFSVIRKSSSTSSLPEQNGTGSSILMASKRSLKPDLQAQTASAITRQIFDGLPKPITGRRNKAALD